MDSIVAFRLAGRLFGVSIMQVHRVLMGDTPLVEAPGAPPHVRGMIDLQGTLVAVIDLPLLLFARSESAPAGLGARFVVVRCAGEAELAALPGDEVLGRVKLAAEDVMSPPEQVVGGPVTGAFYRDEELGLLLDAERLGLA